MHLEIGIIATSILFLMFAIGRLRRTQALCGVRSRRQRTRRIVRS